MSLNQSIGRARLALAVCVAAAALAGCGNNQADSAANPACMPEPLVVTPIRVPVGGTVELSSAAFTCDASYESGKTYEIYLGGLGRKQPRRLSYVAVAEDGSFRTTVQIPLDAAPGEAYLIVRGTAYDEPCGGRTDAAAISCGGYAIGLILQPR